MECLHNYYYYFCGEHIPIFKIRCVKLFVIILGILAIIPILPVIGLITVCNYKDRFMTDIICYLTGFVNIMVGSLTIYALVIICNTLHTYIMEHRSKYSLAESTELVDNV